MANYVFPKVDEVKPPHSKRDLSLYKQATFSVGPLYPILTIDTLPDDWLKIRTVAALESLPMLGPVRGRWKLSFDYYFEPWSNLYGYMDNNSKRSTEEILDELLWTFPIGGVSGSSYDVYSEYNDKFNLYDFVSSAFINGKASLLDFLGVPVGYFGVLRKDEHNVLYLENKPYNASGLLTYLDVVRNYYVNNQEKTIPFIVSNYGHYHRPVAGEEIEIPKYSGVYHRMSLSYLDDYFMTLRYVSRNGILSDGQSIIPDCSDYAAYSEPGISGSVYKVGHLLQVAQQRFNHSGYNVLHDAPHCGLFLRTYRMDLLRGIMNNDVGKYKSIVDTSSGGFDVTTLMFANKLQTLINRVDITGGRFTDWIRTRWGVKPNIEVDRPVYLGSHSTWLDTLDVVATASGNSGDTSSDNSSSNLGQQVSYGQGQLGAGNQRPIICSMNQYGTLQCIMSLVPDVVYSQGFELNTTKTKFADLFDPAFNQLGYQDVYREELSAFPSVSPLSDGKEYQILANVDMSTSVGKRVAWSEYMASLPRAHGDFAYGESLDWWTNGRMYTTEDTTSIDIDAISTEINDLFPVSTSKDGLSMAMRVLRKCGNFDSTTYVYPHLFNGIFASTDALSLNWIISVRFDIEANRALGKRLMPHL